MTGFGLEVYGPSGEIAFTTDVPWNFVVIEEGTLIGSSPIAYTMSGTSDSGTAYRYTYTMPWDSVNISPVTAQPLMFITLPIGKSIVYHSKQYLYTTGARTFYMYATTATLKYIKISPDFSAVASTGPALETSNSNFTLTSPFSSLTGRVVKNNKALYQDTTPKHGLITYLPTGEIDWHSEIPFVNLSAHTIMEEADLYPGFSKSILVVESSTSITGEYLDAYIGISSIGQYDEISGTRFTSYVSRLGESVYTLKVGGFSGAFDIPPMGNNTGYGSFLIHSSRYK